MCRAVYEGQKVVSDMRYSYYLCEKGSEVAIIQLWYCRRSRDHSLRCVGHRSTPASGVSNGLAEIPSEDSAPHNANLMRSRCRMRGVCKHCRLDYAKIIRQNGVAPRTAQHPMTLELHSFKSSARAHLFRSRKWSHSRRLSREEAGG